MDLLNLAMTYYNNEHVHEIFNEHVHNSGAQCKTISTSNHIGGLPVSVIRRDFPILSERHNNHPIIYLDNAASTQRPNCVIERLAKYYASEHSNIHRGAHELARRATDAYEDARRTVASHIHASEDEIIFVRGATEGINLVAQSFARPALHEGDEIILTELEHHANIVPWQLLANDKHANIKVAPIDDMGRVDLCEFERLMNPRVKFASVGHVSNALGTVQPVGEMCEIARRHGVPICIDGAQSAAHTPIDVKAMGADFFVFSGHKTFAPTGIGAVYASRAHQEMGVPYQGGGHMIEDVTFERTTYQTPPRRYEAGTGNIEGAVGLAEALRYVGRIGIGAIERYEDGLMEYMVDALASINGVSIVATTKPRRVCAVSFTMEGRSPDEIGQALSKQGIGVRAGHHCAQPCLRRFGHEATVRPSLGLYNTRDEIDEMVRVIKR